MKNLFNIIGFQLSWWACVLGVKYGYSYLGPLLMFLFIVIHFSIFKSQISELKLIVLFAFIGTIIDTAIANTGILIYNGSYSQELLIAPLWITAMWCGFCATINHSLMWLKEKWILCFLMGAILVLYLILLEKNLKQFHSNLLS